MGRRDASISRDIVKDTGLIEALQRYVEVSARLMHDIDTRLSKKVGAGQPVIVWGTGELTAKLLADTALGRANIEAFVDSNPVNQGGRLHGRAHPGAGDADVRIAADRRGLDPSLPVDRSGDPRARPPESDRRLDGACVKPHISVLTPCYNEEGNVEPLYERIRAVFDALPEYSYEHLFIDNASTDGPWTDPARARGARPATSRSSSTRVTFGHVRSPYHALLQCRGDAVDRHGRRPAGSAGADPGVPREVARRLQGRARRQGGERGIGGDVRDPQDRLRVIDRLSEVKQVRNNTGFGLYDQAFVRRAAPAAGSVSVLPRHRGGARLSLCHDSLPPAAARPAA